MIVYQLFIRVFGASEKKKCGTLDDINDMEIKRLLELGVTHVWLTGVLRHSNYKDTNPLVTKGLAGSPYAVTDYYDIDPDIAEDKENRMSEFENAVSRLHSAGLKVIIDFVPNHLAREYKSRCKPDGEADFGENDITDTAFSPDNNFYYLPGEELSLPVSDENVEYHESPAKASGNNVFSAKPNINDWYDTVKLNYGLDYRDGRKYFERIPDTWRKMLNVLRFWCSKNVDGFRVDMAEMVPVEFWRWTISELRKNYSVTMIAEIYQPDMYRPFIDAGFDFLYDKVGFYNTLESIFKYGKSVESITDIWKSLDGLDDKMLRFMENHDEVRVASRFFMGDAGNAFPYMALAALMNRGPLMIYNGQEYGEKAEGSSGYSGDDGRTSIFDYVMMPSMQPENKGASKKIYGFYKDLLNFKEKHEAISNGSFYDLMWANPWYSDFDPQYVYAFLRYTQKERLLIVINFNLNDVKDVRVTIPEDAVRLLGGCEDEYHVVINPGEYKVIEL
ncbi:MAG: alpha-amylase family glycosyl hydrolase [Candidatus Limimorpha sp.]